MKLLPSHYPAHSFPPKLSALITELSQNYEAPLEMIGCSLIGALSGAIQDFVDVERKPGFTRPCSLNTWVLAESGSRKSTIDRLLMRFFVIYEKAAFEAMKPQLATQTVALLQWKAEYKRLKKLLDSGAANTDAYAEEEEEEEEDDDADADADDADPEEFTSIQEEFQVHLLNKPVEVKVPKIFYKDATPEAIREGLRNWPSSLLNSNEAGALLSTRTMSNLGFFNELWDGERMHIERASSESYVVEAPRSAISLMVQPKTFFDFIKKRGSLARDNGFFARFLFCWPESLVGTRFGVYANGSTEHLDRFEARMLEILMSGTPNGDGIRPSRLVLTLSADAQARLDNFAKNIEADCGPGRYLSDIKDSASKAADNVVRLAALFHYYEGLQGSITSETIGLAADICSWHLVEFKRLFGEEPEVPLELQDATALEKCLSSYSHSRPGQKSVPKKYLFTHGPNAVRKKARLDLALQVLMHQGKISIYQERRTWLVFLNPQWFPAVNQGGYWGQSGVPMLPIR